MTDREGFLKCPECDKEVKEKNLEPHLRRVHGLKPAKAKDVLKSLKDGPRKGKGSFLTTLIMVVILAMVLLMIVTYFFLAGPPGDHIIDPGNNEPEYVNVKFTTEDGWLLYGDFYAPEDNMSSVILVHGMNENRKVYRDLARTLHDFGYGVLSYDSRGFGQSTTRNGQYYASVTQDDVRDGNLDVAAAMDLLRQRGAASKGVTLIGASIGANIVAVSSLEEPEVVALILLSPGMDYQGVMPKGAISAFHGAIMFAAGEGDDIAFESSIKLMDNATNAKALNFSHKSGLDHGTNLLKDQKIYQDVIGWVRSYG